MNMMTEYPCQIVLNRIASLKSDQCKRYKGTYCEMYLSRNDVDVIELHGHKVHYRECSYFPYYIEFDNMYLNNDF